MNITELTLTLSNFTTETIYKHLNFYWNTTLEVLKNFIESGNKEKQLNEHPFQSN